LRKTLLRFLEIQNSSLGCVDAKIQNARLSFMTIPGPD